MSVDKDFKFKIMASLLHGGLPLFSVTILCCMFSVWPAEGTHNDMHNMNAVTV